MPNLNNAILPCINGQVLLVGTAWRNIEICQKEAIEINTEGGDYYFNKARIDAGDGGEGEQHPFCPLFGGGQKCYFE